MKKQLPEILTNTKVFQNITLKKLKVFAEAYYEKNYKGKKVKNTETGFEIIFASSGIRKVTRGSALYYKKGAALIVLRDLIKTAKFSNFGIRKPKDEPSLIGYLNFKSKAKIDGKIEHFHIVVKLNSSGKFFYTHEINRIKKATP